MSNLTKAGCAYSVYQVALRTGAVAKSHRPRSYVFGESYLRQPHSPPRQSSPPQQKKTSRSIMMIQQQLLLPNMKVPPLNCFYAIL